MNQADIIRMAREAGLADACWESEISFLLLKRFAALVAAAEREECAKECEHTAVRMGSEWMAHHCAAAIRARGQS
jgi:hypothetical protein